MIEESATVLACQEGYAIVETQVKAACGSCQAESSCSTSVLSGLFKRRQNSLKVLNPIQAKPGERVIIGLQERALVIVSLVAYLMPLVCMILLAITLQAAAEYWHWPNTELASIGGGLFGLTIGLILLKRFSSRSQRKPYYQAVILRQETSKSVQFV